MPTIRLMNTSDLHQVNMIISRAFTQARMDCGYTHTYVPMCRREFIDFYYSQAPDGCFVADEAGQIRGGVFTHVWGKTGWIGPLAIVPEKHMSGIGKRLAAKAIQYLQQAGCTTIGLETNPRNHRNLGFYGKLGFIPTVLSIDMIKPVSFLYTEPDQLPHKTIYFSRLSDLDKMEFLKRVRLLTDATASGTDYTSLINIIDANHYGETILFTRKSTPIGFVVLQTEPTNTEESNSLLRVFAMVTHPNMPDSYFGYYLIDLVKFAKKHAFERIVIRMPSYSFRVYDLLLKNGFRVYSSDIRMTLEKFPERRDPAVIHINRWV